MPVVMERPHVLHRAKDYHAAVELLNELLYNNPKKGTRQFEMLELLTLLVEDYETRNIPEPPVPTPAAVVEFMLEQKGLKRAALIQPLGGKSRVSEFFAGKRQLSTNQIRALRDLLGVPADLLLDQSGEKSDRVTKVVSLQYHLPRATAGKFFKESGTGKKEIAAKRNPITSKAARKK